MIDLTLLLQMVLGNWFLTNWTGEISSHLKPPKTTKLWIKFPVSLVLYLGSCPKCLSFWTTLIWTGDFWIAAATSLIITGIEKLTWGTKL